MSPRFTVLTPVYNPQPAHLDAAVRSVLGQTLPDLELLLVDDVSTDPQIGPLLDRLAAGDPRVRVLRRETNGGISAASNDGLAAARGEWLALLDHDDLFEPDALAAVDALLRSEPDLDVVYTDEDKTDDAGHHWEAFHKPDWSPTRLLGHMYVGHLTVARTSLIRKVGGFRSEFDGSQDHDLMLRLASITDAVGHVRRVLYHWRVSASSTASTASAKPYAADASRRAIEDHLRREGVAGEVRSTSAAGIFRVVRHLDRQPPVSIVIPSRGGTAKVRGRQRNLLTEAVRSIVERSSYGCYEIVVVLDDAAPSTVREELAEVAGPRLRIVPYADAFNFSAKVNRGVAAASGEYVLLLNDDIEVIDPDWIETMVGLALEPRVGMVGSTLQYEGGTVQHAGHRYAGGVPFHLGVGFPETHPGPMGAYLVDREVSGVTAACALVRREVYLAVGGFDEGLPANFNDIDFSLRLRAAGYDVVVTPYARLFHFESKTREPIIAPWETARLADRWRDELVRDRFHPEPDRTDSLPMRFARGAYSRYRRGGIREISRWIVIHLRQRS